MTLATGTRLGPHEIVAALGVGGMGEVYRAHDTRLHRDVAIIHGFEETDGVQALVLELVEGPTARNGQELFYLAPSGAPMRLGVQRSQTWAATAPTKLIKERYLESHKGEDVWTLALC